MYGEENQIFRITSVRNAAQTKPGRFRATGTKQKKRNRMIWREKARAKREKRSKEAYRGKSGLRRRYGGTFGRKGEKRRKRNRRERQCRITILFPQISSAVFMLAVKTLANRDLKIRYTWYIHNSQRMRDV